MRKNHPSWRDTKVLVLQQYPDHGHAKPKKRGASVPALEGFSHALKEYVNKNPHRMAAYLRSSKELDQESRNLLAAAMEGSLNKPGKATDMKLRYAAAMTDTVFQYWKRLNIEHGIADKGSRSQMKNESAEIALRHFGFNVDIDGVITLLNRSASRRSLEEVKP